MKAGAINLGFLCGMTKRDRKRKHGSGSTGGNQGKPPKIISFCPECPISDMANPERAVHIFASDKKKGVCKAGHVWPVGGLSYAGGLNGN